MDNGYWVKFESWRIEPNIRVPHGIRYSVTLQCMTGRIEGCLASIISTGSLPTGSASEVVRQRGIIGTVGTRSRRTNSNRRDNCWKISGVKPSE